MFGLSGFELAVILLVAFLLFGPEKLPELAKILGKAIGKFREAQAEVNDVIKDNVGQEGVDFIQNPIASLEDLAKPEEERKAAKKVETFAERKARYEAEREAKRKAAAEAAAKKAEEEQAALQAAAEAEAAPAEAATEATPATEEKGE